MPHTDGVVRVASKEGLAIGSPGERDDVGLLVLVGGVGGQRVNDGLALQILGVRMNR